MKLVTSLLVRSLIAQKIEREPTVPNYFLQQHDNLSFEEFEALYPKLRDEMGWYGMGHGLDEDFRIYKRDQFNFKTRDENKRTLRHHGHRHTQNMQMARTQNLFDQTGECPDAVSGAVAWDLDQSASGFLSLEGKTIVLDHDVDLAGEGLIIQNGGKLIFKDNGVNGDKITLRAKSIEIKNDGELWIGSRSCRYQGQADIVLYGEENDMTTSSQAGVKYIWTHDGGVWEMHGKEKLPWTRLNEHIFRNNVPAEELKWKQTKHVNVSDNILGNRLIFHLLSAEGDLKNVYTVNSGESFADIQMVVNGLQSDEILLFTQDFLFELNTEAKTFFVGLGFDEPTLDGILATESSRKYSQIAGLWNTSGQTSFISISPQNDLIHNGLKGTVGPIDLGGMKSGFQFQAEINNNWAFDTTPTLAETQAAMDAGGWDQMPTRFQNSFSQTVNYSGPDAGGVPILDLEADVSSWEVGDQIVVAATHFDSRESEVFTIVECQACSSNQIQVDRTPTNTHWGRIDTRSGADQRAEVGLLSRNIRFYGEMNQDNVCRYVRTREQTNADSPNADNNYCSYYNDINGGEQDYHGAHSIVTSGFKNVHLSHIEIFNAGQPRVGRYPFHWHHAGYAGTRGGYDDPSSIDSLSIHDAFSRWATIHGTHEATISNTVGYNTFGHGFFLEDGFESYNSFIGNLGILVKPGIILPSERSNSICGTTGDGYGYTDYAAGDHCEGLSVFWFANIHNHVHDNVAVGGNAGYWLFTHTAYDYQYDALPIHAESGKREWINNKACCTSRGFAIDESIMDEPPTPEFPVAQFSIGNEFGVRFKSMNEDHRTKDEAANDDRPNLWADPMSNWADLEFNGLNIHHTNEKNWSRGASIHLLNCHFSDNTRGWVHKGTAPVPGATKSFKNSHFVGFTPNTGHKLCTHDQNVNNVDSLDLATPRVCGDSRDGVVDLVNERPMTDILVRRLIYWYKTDDDDVYRQHGRDQWYPIQGMSIYDSFIPTMVQNITFMDYPAKNDAGARRHALGAHFNHKFGLIPKAFALRDIKYVNVDNYFQNSYTESTEENGDDYTIWTSYGDTMGTTAANKIRSETDGELTTGYTDIDGIWTNGQPAYVLPPKQLNINTNCRFIAGGEEVGVGAPGIKVCPITTPYGSFTLRTYEQGTIDANNGRQFLVTTLCEAGNCELNEGSPMRYLSASKTLDNFIFTNLEAFKTHKMEFKSSMPPAHMVFELNDSEFNSWYRMSLCVGKTTTVNEINPMRFNYKNDIVGQGFTSEHTVATSFEELNLAENDSYWHDTTRGWIHIKMIQSEDRTKGGTIVERDGNEPDQSLWQTYQYSDDPGWNLNSPYCETPLRDGAAERNQEWCSDEFRNDQGIGSRWRMNMAYGEHQLEIKLDSSSLTGEVQCDDFEYPEPPIPENEQLAAEEAIRIEKDISLWGGFTWTADMLDTTSIEYTTTHQLFVDFFNNIFDGIKTTYGYTLTVDITFVAPGELTVPENRKRRDVSLQPGVIVVVSFNGMSNVDVSALTLDLEIETAVTSAYTQMPDGFDGLIATSYPALMPNQVQIVNALGSTGCWTCESHSMEGCILNGQWEMCQSQDDNSDQLLNRFEPVCFVELRERDQRVNSIKTGCMDKHACQVHQRQNKMDGARKDFSQCRPEYRLINRRYAKEPSVCRQCFAACDVNGVDDDMCFGGMNSNEHANDDAKRADAKWIEYPSDMATTYWNSETQFSPAYLLGVPIGTSVSLENDLVYVESSDNKVFWGQTRGTSLGPSKTRPVTPGDEMVYWGLQDQTIDWWMSDLIAAQNVYYSRGTVDQQIFNPN